VNQKVLHKKSPALYGLCTEKVHKVREFKGNYDPVNRAYLKKNAKKDSKAVVK